MKRALLLLSTFAIFANALAAQPSSLLKGASPAPDVSPTQSDPLGRDTPYGSVFGFLQMAQTGNYKASADYLQLSAARRLSQGPDLASKLKVLMDRAFVGSMRRISQRPEGNVESGDMGTQNIGAFVVSGEADVSVMLVRVSDPSAGKIWLFSYETLSRVPDLYDNLQSHRIEKKLPHVLVSRLFLGMPLWQWLALLIAVPVAAGIAWAIIIILAIPRRLWVKYRKRPNIYSYKHVSAPLLLMFGAMAHRALASYLGLPLLPRIYYYRTTSVAIEIGFFWLLLRVTSITMQRLRIHAIGIGRIGTGSLMVLGERLLKVAILAIAALAILGTFGFNLTTVLAGLGIGGIAIAFAAQKTLENLFGGVSVLADEVIRVGDFCRFGDKVGTVEDISLRSTRVRTLDRSQLSIPNGALATMNIENFSRRDKIWFSPTIALSLDTSPDQLRYLLTEVRRMLYQHAKVETDSARIRLAGFERGAINLEIFSYVLTQDFTEFTAIREDLLFRIMEIARESGVGFASSSQTVYLGQDAPPSAETAALVEKKVQQWRDQNKLPFPDFSSAEKDAMRGTIAYPGRESGLENRH